MGPRSLPILTLLALSWHHVRSQDTAALIVGGLTYDELDDDGNPLFTASVELFGCPDRSQDSYEVDAYPFQNAFTSGHLWEDLALSCGGFGCENEACDGTTAQCFTWGPRTGNEDQWQPHSDLYENLWNFVIVEAPDLDSDDTSTLYPVTIGPTYRTQIYTDGDWREYRDIPGENIPWTASRCVVQVGSDVFHIDEIVYRLDTLTWEVEELWPVPVDLSRAERCTAQTIYGRPGVLLKSGFWYDIERHTWEEMAFPPDSDFLVESPNSAFSFQGKMTIFGNPLCDSEGDCRYADVVQYDEDENVWTSIGNMILSRQGLDVIEIPSEWCDDILGPSAGTTHPDDTTADPSTTDPPIPGEGTDNVAMIVGGIIGIDAGEIVSSVELFGCPGYQGQSLPIDDYPLNVFLPGGMYWESENKVLVCGGSSCPDGSEGENCLVTNECYEYTPDGGWQNFSSLNRNKWAHIMVDIININDGGSGETYPAVIGLDLGTEIYNPLNSAWEAYEKAPDTVWRTTDCLVQHGDSIYHLRNDFIRLDTTTWTPEELEQPPLFLRDGDTCAIVRIDGFSGLMLSSGYWYNFQSAVWNAVLFPPYPTFVDIQEPDVLFGYRGQPTIFGNPTCNSEGECQYLDVIQYSPEDDAWYNIGEMIHQRHLHTVIEVPSSFCEQAAPPPPSFDSAAILIGGSTNVDYGEDGDLGGEDTNGVALSTVEIFGCPQQPTSSIRLPDFPTPITSTGGVYYPDGEHVIVCGGRPCDDTDFFCDPTEACYQWTPENGWEAAEEGNLVLPRFAHKMVLAPDHDSGTSARVPLVLGGTGPLLYPGDYYPNIVTEVYDPETEAWKQYDLLEYDSWNSFGCLTQYNDDVYAITTEGVRVLHTATWIFDDFGGATPDFLQPVTKCSPVDIDGQLGIMLRNGYWFNLNSTEWEHEKFPPNNPFVAEADAMHYFRGKPTVFGSPECDSEGNCYYTEVIQYNSDYDQWDSLGKISESKQFHEVVEVPREICDRISAVTSEPPTSTTSTTTEAVTDPYIAPDTTTVAMIIGGRWDDALSLPTMSSVELFGCPGYEERSFPLLDFPTGIYLTGATYFQNNQDVGKVVACGGFGCDGTCPPTNRCFEWTLDSGDWEETPSLNTEKGGHLMALAQNLDNVIDVNGEQVVVDELVPMVIGRDETTEIYNTTSREWMPYKDISEVTVDWLTYNCLIQIDDNIYHIGDQLYEFNTLEWEITRTIEVPSFLQLPGVCSQARIRDIEGILLTNGYWFNLKTEVWEQIRFPPYPEIEPYIPTNLMMISFRGKPTIFNMPTCDSEGECILNDVVQYDDFNDRWKSIGTMLHHRGLSTIVEVPEEYCEVTRYEPPTRRTAAIIVGGTSSLDNPSANILQTVELLGCPRSESIPLDDFPEPIYLTAGIHFINDEENEPNGKVVVCGGWTTRIEDRCWELVPGDNTMTWAETDYTLQGVRWAHEMVLAPDFNSGRNKRVPMVIGGQNRDTEIWDPYAREWNVYNELPLTQGDSWSSVECTVIYQDVMYHISTNLYSLDLFNWELTDHGEVPQYARRPGRCQIAEDEDDIAGIMLRNGYWFSLVDMRWAAKRFPPNPTIADDADALYGFRGSSTIFGSPICDEQGLCEYREVLWYNPDRDIYESLGNMREQRFHHEIIEVPDSICAFVERVDPTTDTPFPGSTAEPPPDPVVDEESAVLIVGGDWIHIGEGGLVVIQSAELFGCDDSLDPDTGEYVGKPVDDYPVGVYATGGIYYEQSGDEEGAGQVVVCGGYGCSSPEIVSCAVSTACYKWTPSAQWEPFDANLNDTKRGHIMVTAQNLDSGSEELVPIVLGQNRATEAYDPQSGEWLPYRDLDETSWTADACLVQYGDRVYEIGDSRATDVFELDLTTWTTTNIGTKPEFMPTPGTCAVTKVDGIPGIMTSVGYWFNLNERTWTAKRFPPYYDNVHTAHGGMASFRGKATIFGTQHCNEEGTCDNIGVYQYEEASDEWRYLGKQVHSRDQHEIIEVPKSFCDVAPPTPMETAAMIIGGVGSGTWNRVLHETVELFGCPGMDSFQIEPLPVSIYLSAGRYFEVLDRDQVELSGSVLVCGGFTCQDPANSQECGISSECYQYAPNGTWTTRPEQLDQGRWAQLLAAVVDVNSGSNTKVPLLLGQEEETIIYDYLEGAWEQYLDLEQASWLSMGCFIQHEDTIYHIRTEVHSLNTLTWETKLISEVPEILAQHPGKCAISVIEGTTGILVRNGFWFNLETETWEARRFPPFINIADQPDALFSYQGRPTMFGSPICDGEGNCEYTEVLQYNEETDTWDSLGFMVEGRQHHDVVEVPISFCDEYANMQHVDKVEETVVSSVVPQQDDIQTVAMIIGGFWDNDLGNENQLQVIPEVELFGCPDSPDSSIILQDYPESIYLSGGRYFEDMDMVVSCGGYSCQGLRCLIINDCFQWTPENQWEPFTANLNYEKWSHIMTEVVNLDGDGETLVPMVLGQNSVTEIWNPDENVWERYKDLEGFNWASMSCLFQEGNYIYHMRRDIERLDTTTWTIENLGLVPDFLENPGKCSYLEAGGVPGILLRNGYWYNIEENTWQQQRFPPYANVAPEPDAVWKFRGKPTVFGSTVCEGDGTCIYTGIEQYDLDTNTWIHLGRMAQTRVFHDVIEVPVSFCDFEANPLLPTSSAAMIIGGTSVDGSSSPEIYNSVEIFGCPGEEGTIPGPDFPYPHYLAGGLYYSQDGSVENGNVIVCGGFGCPDGENCGPLASCYEYNPLTSNEWREASPLTTAKWAHLMTTAPDLINSVSNREMPIAIGLTDETQIRDYDTAKWRDYTALPDGSNDWLAFGCLVRYRYNVYHIREEVFELNTLYWETTNLGPIPEFMADGGIGPGRCAITEIDNEVGIMLRNGFFYQLNDKSWHQKKFPPHITSSIGFPSDSLYTFRGKPTYFGSPTCDENVECHYTEILQYQDRNFDWIKLGNMATSRTGHEVIEIPAAFCQTGATTTTTTAAPATTNNPPDDQIETVAMIIGGAGNRDTGAGILDSVELFGCPGTTTTVELDDFPVPVYLAAGVYYADEVKVVVCGGNQCEDSSNPRDCSVSRTCYEYNPIRNGWSRPPAELVNVKWQHFMGLTDYDNSRRVPIVLGYGEETEIYNPDTEQWEEYTDLEEDGWTSFFCLIQVGNSIWQMRDGIFELNLDSWELTPYGEPPEQLRNSGHCSYLEIDGKPGLLLRNGYWFNIEDESWEQKRFPPYPSFYQEPNALFSFRNKPTMFGNPVCEDDGSCQYKEIIQYNVNTDMWNTIGQMQHARGFHTVVEIPVSFCERVTPSTPKTTTTDGSPTDSTEPTDPDSTTEDPGNPPTTTDSSASIANSILLMACLYIAQAFLQ